MRERRRSIDEGMTLIEVVVALLVFGIISTGIITAMTTIARMTTDNRARVTAENLASREIDRMRALADPFKVMAATSTADRAGVDYVVDGRTYTIKRAVSWVSKTGTDVPCSSGTSLFYVRVNVRVTWPGMLANTAPVQDDTIMAPTSSLSDASTGGISVSIVDDANQGQPGVGVAIKANTGGTTPTNQPANTDSAGCSYAGNISQGNYDVTISKSGWIDTAQNQAPTASVAVVKGATKSPSFNPFAQAATFTTKYVGANGALSTAFTMPTSPGFPVSFLNNGSTWLAPSAAAQNASVLRYPFSTAYGVMAGARVSSDGTKECQSVDPANWPAGTSNGVQLAAGVRATASGTAGSTPVATIPVGVVLVKIPAGQVLGATQATPPAGTPSCGISGSVFVYPLSGNGSWQAIALPFGAWKLYAGTSTSNAVVLTSSSIAVQSNAAPTTVGSDGTFVLDPRAAKQ